MHPLVSTPWGGTRNNSWRRNKELLFEKEPGTARVKTHQKTGEVRNAPPRITPWGRNKELHLEEEQIKMRTRN
jgi:hypothetical protein